MQTELFTYNDALEHVLDSMDIDRSSRGLRQARRAVQRAYRDFPMKFNWASYWTRGQITTVEADLTGTVTYTQSNRELTLSGGTWPSWITYGRVLINRVTYEVDQLISSTVITLSVNSNPGADISTATSFIAYQDAYLLPVDCQRVKQVLDVLGLYYPEYVTMEEYLQRNRGWITPSVPTLYSFAGHPKFYGSLAIYFAPPPAPGQARTYDFIYQRKPRPMAIDNYNTGTVSVTNATTAVTGANTVFPPNCVGSLIRFSADGQNLPTSVFGSLTGEDNPYFAQRVITAWTDATHVTIDQPADANVSLSNVLYTISDPVDIEDGAMFTYFLRMCELEFARITNREDRDEKEQVADKAFREAMAADARNDATSAEGVSRRDSITHLRDLGRVIPNG